MEVDFAAQRLSLYWESPVQTAASLSFGLKDRHNA